MNLKNIDFGAEYHISVSLNVNDQSWNGGITLITPPCPDPDPVDSKKCLVGDSNLPEFEERERPITTPKTSIETIIGNSTVSIKTESNGMDVYTSSISSFYYPSSSSNSSPNVHHNKVDLLFYCKKRDVSCSACICPYILSSHYL